MIETLILACVIVIAGTFCVWAQEKSDMPRWVREAEELLESIDDYTAVFYRQVKVKGELKEKETMFLKFKKPLKIYLKWIESPYMGRELLYVEGENNNRMKIHGTGLLSHVTINIDPCSSLFLKSSRHPITEIGLVFIVKFIGREFRKGIERGEVDIIYRGEETVFGRKTVKVEGVFPRDAGKGYYCYRAVVNMDLETKIPIAIEVYDWEDELFEYYGFEGIVLNAGLDEDDFDPKNVQYGF
jgi:hypothetical protein